MGGNTGAADVTSRANPSKGSKSTMSESAEPKTSNNNMKGQWRRDYTPKQYSQQDKNKNPKCYVKEKS